MADPVVSGEFENGSWRLDSDIQGDSHKAEMTLETTRLRKVIIKLENLSDREDGITPIERIIKPNSQNSLLLTYQDGVVLSVNEVEVRPDRFDNPIKLDHDPSDDYYRYRFDEGVHTTVSILKSLKVFLPNNLQMCLPALDEDVRLRKIVSAHFVDYLEYCIGQKNQPDNLATSLKIARRFTPPHFQLHDDCINLEDENQFQYVAMSSGVLYGLGRELPPENLIEINYSADYIINVEDAELPYSQHLNGFPGINCRLFVYSSMIQQEFLSIGFVFKHEVESTNFRMPVTATITFEYDSRILNVDTISRVITTSTPTMGCPVFMNTSSYRTFFGRGGLIKVSIRKEDNEAMLKGYSGINRNAVIKERGIERSIESARTVRDINTQLLQTAFNLDANVPDTTIFPNHVTTRRVFDILYHGTTDLTNDNIVDVYTQANAVGCHQVMEYCNQAIQASYPEGEKRSDSIELDSQRRALDALQTVVKDEIYLQDYINTISVIKNKPIDEYSPCVVYRFPNGGFHHCL